MPSPEVQNRFQKALYYAFQSYGEHGEPIVSDTLAELDVRWEYVEREGLDSQGNTIRIDAVVVVNQDILIGSLMWLGSEDDLVGTSGFPSSDLMRVVNFEKTPDYRDRAYYREVFLARWSNTFPETA